MTIRDYLSREARQITNHALADYTDLKSFPATQQKKREQFLEMMGIEHLPPASKRPPVKATVTDVIMRPYYHIEKLYYESLPHLYVTANLYVPNDNAHPMPGKSPTHRPGVLYVCGHSDIQKAYYQAQARRFAELGFVCLIVDTVQYSELRGYHHGCYREGWWHWYSRGYTSGGIELYNGIRGLDLLCQRPEVDPTRLGVTGTSGGGAVSWYVGAADERVKVVAPSCGTATLASHIADRTIDGHCDCMWWTNTYLWDLADVGALIAPRPLMIASADRDQIFTIESIREVHSQLKHLYKMVKAENNLHLVEGHGGHAYFENTRTSIFSLFLKHLVGKEIPPEKVGDLSEAPEHQESLETLRVFIKGSPTDNINPTIQDTFISLPAPPKITNQAELDTTRHEVIQKLKEKTFRAFPSSPPPLEVKREFEMVSGANNGCRFSFHSEEGWRLHGEFYLPRTVAAPAPVVVGLRPPDEERWQTEGFAGAIQAPWGKAYIETRGIGDTAWGQSLQWHIRRASAWTGRTIASMRIWDTLRALEAVRSLVEVDGNQVALAAQGEMGVIALYAALLDGKIRTVFLQSPPATHNAPSSKEGRGEAIELLNVLRITDLPQVAGLLCPTEVVLIGGAPKEYEWAEEVYRTLGLATKFHRINDISSWKL